MVGTYFNEKQIILIEQLSELLKDERIKDNEALKTLLFEIIISNEVEESINKSLKENLFSSLFTSMNYNLKAMKNY